MGWGSIRRRCRPTRLKKFVIPIFLLVGAGLSHSFYRIRDGKKLALAIVGVLVALKIAAIGMRRLEAEQARKRMEAIRNEFLRQIAP